MTFIGIQAGANRPQLTLRSAHLSPRILGTTATSARIALVSTTALLLGGDDVAITVDVGVGCRLQIVDTAGTVAYNAQGAASSWTVTVQVADGGLLLWKGEPFVVSDGADVTRSTTVDLAGTGIACLRESLVLGRTGERGGSLLARTRVSHGGRALLAEDLDLRCAGSRERPGILGTHRVVDTASLLGRRLPAVPEAAARLFPLAGDGALLRYLGFELHRSGVPAVYDEWHRELTREAGEQH